MKARSLDRRIASAAQRWIGNENRGGWIQSLREIAGTFQRCRYTHKVRRLRRDGMRLFVGIEEEQLLSIMVRIKPRYLDWAAQGYSPDIVAVEWPRQRRRLGCVPESVIVDVRVGIQGFIAQEVVAAPVVSLASVLGDDLDHAAAVVAKFRHIVVAKDLDFGDGVLVGGHAHLVGAARLAGIQTIDRGNGGTAALAVEIRQVRAKALTHGFNVVDIRRSRHQAQQ